MPTRVLHAPPPRILRPCDRPDGAVESLEIWGSADILIKGILEGTGFSSLYLAKVKVHPASENYTNYKCSNN